MKTRTNLLAVAECSIMVALATVLSMLKLFELPYGGSITPASMLPIIIIAYRHGAKFGLGSAVVASGIQALLGLKNFSYFTTWQSLVTLAVFDYVIAFSVFGLGGIFKKCIKKQSLSMLMGSALACLLRYVCHVISGATVWAGLSIPTEAALIYSIGYNATYMIPETVITLLCCVYVASALDFSARVPRRIKSEKLDTVSAYLYLSAGLAALITLVADTVMVFSKLQDPNTGDLVFANVTTVEPLPLIIVTVCGAAVAGVLALLASRRVNSK